MNKMKSMMLALGLGLGLSSAISGYAISAPTCPSGCPDLERLCQSTNDAGTCGFYRQHCWYCEFEGQGVPPK